MTLFPQGHVLYPPAPFSKLSAMIRFCIALVAAQLAMVVRGLEISRCFIPPRTRVGCSKRLPARFTSLIPALRANSTIADPNAAPASALSQTARHQNCRWRRHFSSAPRPLRRRTAALSRLQSARVDRRRVQRQVQSLRRLQCGVLESVRKIRREIPQRFAQWRNARLGR